MLFSSILCSCFGNFNINRKKCYFIEGTFSSELNDKKYTLEIRLISEDEFDSAGNVNVINDLVLHENNFFSIDLRVIDGFGDIYRINLSNLRDDCPNTKDVPICYIDDNGVEISPLYPHNVEELYLVIYQSQYIYFERAQ